VFAKSMPDPSDKTQISSETGCERQALVTTKGAAIQYIYQQFSSRGSGTAVVHLKGVESDVVLLDSRNFNLFRQGASWSYRVGGHYTSSPARLPFGPGSEWYIVIIPGWGGQVIAQVGLV